MKTDVARRTWKKIHTGVAPSGVRQPPVSLTHRPQDHPADGAAASSVSTLVGICVNGHHVSGSGGGELRRAWRSVGWVTLPDKRTSTKAASIASAVTGAAANLARRRLR